MWTRRIMVRKVKVDFVWWTRELPPPLTMMRYLNTSHQISTLPSAPSSRPARFPRPYGRCGPSIYIPWHTLERDGGPVDGRIPHESRRRFCDCPRSCHAAVRGRIDEGVPPELTLRSLVPSAVSVGSPTSRAVLAGA